MKSCTFIVLITFFLTQSSCFFRNAYGQQKKLFYRNQYPSWSPNGTKIIFNSDRLGNQDLFIMNPDGSDLKLLYSSGFDDIQPKWAKNSNKIVFASNLDGDWEVFQINGDGSGLVQITNNAINDRMPDWSPDGTKIVYFQGEYADGNLNIVRADGSNSRALTDFPGYNPSWSINNQIAFDANSDEGYGIFLIEPDGSKMIQITSGTDFRPEWSPDGSKIAFASSRTGNWECFIGDENGQNVVKLTNIGGRDFWQTWSPEGNKMAFASNRFGNYEIISINADGTNSKRLTYQPEGELMGVIMNDGIRKGWKKYRRFKKNYNPSDIVAFGNLVDYGATLESNGQLKYALEIYKLVIDAYPKRASGYALAGEIYLALKQKDLAIFHYEKALDIDPENQYYLGRYKASLDD